LTQVLRFLKTNKELHLERSKNIIQTHLFEIASKESATIQKNACIFIEDFIVAIQEAFEKTDSPHNQEIISFLEGLKKEKEYDTLNISVLLLLCRSRTTLLRKMRTPKNFRS